MNFDNLPHSKGLKFQKKNSNIWRQNREIKGQKPTFFFLKNGIITPDVRYIPTYIKLIYRNCVFRYILLK